MLRKKNKKGSVQDLIMVIVILLFFSIVVLIGFKVGSSMNTIIQANDDLPTESKSAFSELVDVYPGTIDNVFLFLAIGMAIVTLTLAALVKVHPIFIPFFIISLIIVILISGIASNIYGEMAANSLLATEADQLIFISSIMNILPILITVIGVLLMVIMYKLGDPAV